MKKNLTISLFVTLSLFHITTHSKDEFSNATEKANKPTIGRPLPEVAYQQVAEEYSKEFESVDTDFIMFLQNRYKRNKDLKNLADEHKLISTLSNNLTNNPHLTSKDLPMCAFAACTQHLYFQQLIADTQTYPCNYLLAPFEQNYSFKLHPMNSYKFEEFLLSLPAAQIILYRQTIVKNLAKFLLMKLAKR